MRSSVQIVTPPAVEPVTLDQIRAHFRVDTEINDTELTLYATAARAMAENYLNRCLITTGLLWTMVPDYEPASILPTYSSHRRSIEFPRGSVLAISSVVLTDIAGTQTTLAAPAYVADLALTPPRIRFDYSTGLIPTAQPVQHFQIGFTSGYGSTAAAVPVPIVNAILITALHLYERRGDDDAGGLPRAIEWLLDPYRVMYFGG